MATLQTHARRLARLAPPLSRAAVTGVAAWALRRDARAWFERAQAMVELALDESPPNARVIAKESFARNILFHVDYERFARNSFHWVCKRLRALEVPEADQIAGIVRRHDGPVVYASAHIGCYLAALMRTAQILAPAKPVAVIKRELENDRERRAYRHFRSLGVELELLRVGARPAARALRILQRGGHLVVLFDVHEGFGSGRRSPCELFHRPAALPLGPAALAARSGAMIVPLAVLGDGHAERVVFEQPILPHESPDAMVRSLARCLEGWIRESPGSWMLWPHLGDLWASNSTAANRVSDVREPSQR